MSICATLVELPCAASANGPAPNAPVPGPVANPRLSACRTDIGNEDRLDYTGQSWSMKLKKAARYVRLFGPRWTLAKVKGQYHMKRRYASLPPQGTSSAEGQHVGLIGCGNYAFTNIAYYLRKNFGSVIRGAMDTDIHRAASLFEEYRLAYYTDNAAQIIADPRIDTVFIASNHASHAEYAIGALEAGKHVHIEKPHVVSEDQLIRLCRTAERSQGRILSVGFNRPRSRIGRAIKSYLDSQTGAAMYSWFVVGHEIGPDHWYSNQGEGGRLLGNLCHWTDFLYAIVPPNARFPITICPTQSTRSDCDIAVTYTFGDGSIGAITFSAKGHAFEGVRERFGAQRGDVVILMDDFKDLLVDVVDRRHRLSPFYRDAGHERSICGSYLAALGSEPACTIEYVWETGQLFLKTKEAFDGNAPITVYPYQSAPSASRTTG